MRSTRVAGIEVMWHSHSGGRDAEPASTCIRFCAYEMHCTNPSQSFSPRATDSDLSPPHPRAACASLTCCRSMNEPLLRRVGRQASCCEDSELHLTRSIINREGSRAWSGVAAHSPRQPPCLRTATCQSCLAHLQLQRPCIRRHEMGPEVPRGSAGSGPGPINRGVRALSLGGEIAGGRRLGTSTKVAQVAQVYKLPTAQVASAFSRLLSSNAFIDLFASAIPDHRCCGQGL